MKKLFFIFSAMLVVSSVFAQERVELNAETARILGLESLAQEIEIKEANYDLRILKANLEDKLYILPSDKELIQQAQMVASQESVAPRDRKAPQNYIFVDAQLDKNEKAFSKVPLKFSIDISGEKYPLHVWDPTTQSYQGTYVVESTSDQSATGTSFFLLIPAEVIEVLRTKELSEPKPFDIYAQVQAEAELSQVKLAQIDILNIDGPDGTDSTIDKSVSKWWFWWRPPPPPPDLDITNGMNRIREGRKDFTTYEFGASTGYWTRQHYNQSTNHYAVGSYLWTDIKAFGHSLRFLNIDLHGAAWENHWNTDMWGDLRVYVFTHWKLYHCQRHFRENSWKGYVEYEKSKEWSKTFYPGGYPITVTAGVRGTISSNWSMRLNKTNKELKVLGEPEAVLAVYAWGGLDYSIDIGGLGFTFFQAGVKGELRLVTGQLYVKGYIRAAAKRAGAKATIKIIGPNGDIGPFVKYTVLESFVEEECHSISHWMPWPLSDWVEWVCKSVTRVKPVEKEHYWPIARYWSGWGYTTTLERYGSI